VEIVTTSTEPNPKDFPKYDFTHYNTQGVINIGESLAEKLIDLSED